MKSTGRTSYDCGQGIASEASGNSYVTGSLSGTSSFGTRIYTAEEIIIKTEDGILRTLLKSKHKPRI